MRNICLQVAVTGVSVSVESGIVTLRGTVPTLWMKERAREQAIKAEDVVTVASEVTVARGESDSVLAELVAAASALCLLDHLRRGCRG